MLKVSVIVPSYNHAQYIKQRIDSILCQTYGNFELIVLDDCSSDNSIQVIDNYKYDKRLSHFIVNQENSGSTFHQWKKGIDLAKGDIIWIAESDDFCKEDFLDKLVRHFDEPDINLVYCRSYDVDHNAHVLSLSYSHLDWCDHSFIKDGNKEVRDHLYINNTIPNVSAVLFRKSFYRPSYLNTEFKLAGDWLFYVGMLLNGKIAYHNEPLNYHRFHFQNVRSSEIRSLNAFKERLDVVNFINENYTLSKAKYKEALQFQIRLFVSNNYIKSFFRIGFLKSLFALFRNNFLYYNLLLVAIRNRVFGVFSTKLNR